MTAAEGGLTVRRLRLNDPDAGFSPEDLRRTPQQRFDVAEELIRLAFQMGGRNDRVQKSVARVVRREG